MIWSRCGGPARGPVLVMLHGLGATGEVYADLERLLPGAWPGGWLVTDLPGHGRSPRAAAYGFDDQAGLVAGTVLEQVPAGREVVLLGHSMGGLVALAAAPLLPAARGVAAFSTKTWWPPAHVEAARAQAGRPVRTFVARADALERHRRVAGLDGLVAPDDPRLEPGVVPADDPRDGWRLAQDRGTHDFGTPDVAALLARVSVPVLLARGSEDPFVREQNLRDLVPEPVTWAGLGHNPHVEDPAAVLRLALSLL